MHNMQTAQGRGANRGYDVSEALRRAEARNEKYREDNGGACRTAMTWAFALAVSLAVNAAMAAPLFHKVGQFAAWMKGGAL